MSSLKGRIRVCADESLQARVGQALLESGKNAELSVVVAGLVLASKSDNLEKSLGPGISDEEIVAYVGLLA